MLGSTSHRQIDRVERQTDIEMGRQAGKQGWRDCVTNGMTGTGDERHWKIQRKKLRKK